MIIKIENIPEGQKIKSINFNIDFESGVSETIFELPVEKTIRQDESKIFPANDSTVENFQNNQIPNIEIEKRSPKEVPAEMLDMEF